ncbi:Fanconi anemia core complex-associated protein 20 [Heteronotia binoei]|uniref:Fanconi anemia core complex-associated protein 20 n=1 Tax=Heteronotia binoei TaxID=13085 RepID=UPI00292D004E|nr:Fanconi anemia core complex-associated protein 20 [Heteronotia binoei]
MAGEQLHILTGGGGKLRLKRKRPPASGGAGLPPPPPPPDRPQTRDSNLGWFEAQGLSEADRTWLALLKAADPQLNLSTLGKVARFPVFLNKSSQITNPQPKPETFNFGLEQIQWQPFPLYRKEGNIINHRIPQNLESPTTSLVEQEIYEDERSNTVSPVPVQTPLVANKHTPKKSKTGHGTGHSSKDCGKIKNSPRTHRQNSPRFFGPTAVQQKLGLRELWKKASTQSQLKSATESEKQRASSKDTLGQNRTALLLPSQGSPANSSASGLQQKSVCQNEDLSTLDCCPMCQFHFTGTLSQLDRDSHLAKCLSESTEDVIW